MDLIELLLSDGEVINRNSMSLKKELYDFSTIDDIFISQSITIVSSHASSTIKLKKIQINGTEINFSKIKFEGSVVITQSNKISLVNCTVNYAVIGNGALYIVDSQLVNLKNVSISNTDLPGLYLAESDAIACDMKISNLKESLLVLNTHSKLNIEHSILFGTKANAVYASESEFYVKSSTIYDTDYPALYIQESKCSIDKCRIYNIKQNGISLNKVDKAVITNNTLYNIDGSGIACLEQSQAKISKNEISQNEGNGIYISSNSNIEVSDNYIHDNRYPGIAVLVKSIAKIYNNKINGIHYSGICARDAERVEIYGCNVSAVEECGFSVSDTPDCVIRNCKVCDCRIAAFESYNNSIVSFYDNDVKNIGEYACLSYTGGSITATNNKVKKVGKGFAKLCHKGGGTFQNNKIKDCPRLFDGQTEGTYFFFKNPSYEDCTNDQSSAKEGMRVDPKYVDNQVNLCLKCNKNPRDVFLLDCGHRILCESCAKIIKDNHETCPLCRFPITGITQGYQIADDDLCIICQNTKANCIIMPCGHMGACSGCLEKWYQENRTCPFCRSDNTFFKHIVTDM